MIDSIIAFIIILQYFTDYEKCDSRKSNNSTKARNWASNLAIHHQQQNRVYELECNF